MSLRGLTSWRGLAAAWAMHGITKLAQTVQALSAEMTNGMIRLQPESRRNRSVLMGSIGTWGLNSLMGSQEWNPLDGLGRIVRVDPNLGVESKSTLAIQRRTSSPDMIRETNSVMRTAPTVGGFKIAARGKGPKLYPTVGCLKLAARGGYNKVT